MNNLENQIDLINHEIKSRIKQKGVQNIFGDRKLIKLTSHKASLETILKSENKCEQCDGLGYMEHDECDCPHCEGNHECNECWGDGVVYNNAK